MKARSSSTRFDFGELARDYDRWYDTPAGRAYDRVQKWDVRHLLRRARPGERLLEVGCGTGHWCSFFASMGYEVFGVDVSAEMIAVARGSVGGCRFEVGDGCALRFEDGSFDVSAAMATLEFVGDPALAVREMARCVRPGGSLVVGVLNRLSPLNRRRLAKGKSPYVFGRLFAPEELRRLLSPYGGVRMVASACCGRDRRSRNGLEGPLIVAEVRR